VHFLAFLGIAAIAVLLVGSEWFGHTRTLLLDRVKDDLRVRATVFRAPLAAALARGDLAGLDRIAKDLGRETHTRVTWIDPTGKVLADSDHDPATMENHADRPEIREALSGHVGSSLRMSPTLQTEVIYVAIPVESRDAVTGVLRTAVASHFLEAASDSIRSRIFVASAILVLVVLAGTYLAVRPLRTFLRRVAEGSQRLGAGDLRCRLPVPRLQETGAVSVAWNRMAGRIEERVDMLERETRTRETLLGSMVEGVVAVDAGERILEINTAAARLFGVSPSRVKGKILQEEIRNTELQRFVREALDSSDVIEADILVLEPEERFLQAHGTRLPDPERGEPGALVVLHDVTRIKQLERVRRDFVANVSHELRTPITSIQGFLETLLDPEGVTPEEAHRFHEIILKEANRLHAMLEDLLVLARVEQETENAGFRLERREVRGVIESAIENCREVAARKGITIDVVGPEGLVASVHGTLLERALENLIDNAVHYSEAGRRVTIEACEEGGEVVLRVRDEGLGIPPEHLSRIFERFYRIPRFRSRKPEGTGLGLAIVKYVVQAHRGRVEVESSPGRGSVFTIRLPRPA